MRLGVQANTIWRYEKGSIQPSAQIVIALKALAEQSAVEESSATFPDALSALNAQASRLVVEQQTAAIKELLKTSGTKNAKGTKC